MKRLAVLLFVPTLTLAATVPESVQLWKKQADFFWAMDFSKEPAFKASLKDYYTKVYRGELLKKRTTWIDEGSLESEHFSSLYGDLKDTTFSDVKQIKKNIYEVAGSQHSCYDMDYNPPLMETVVADYKITNLTQQQVDAWLASLGPAARAELCLKVQRTISLVVNPSDGLIESEKWTVKSSTAELSPNK